MRLCKQSYEKHLFYIKNGNGYFIFRYANNDSGRSLADFKINIVELSKYSPIYTHLCWIIWCKGTWGHVSINTLSTLNQYPWLTLSWLFINFLIDTPLKLIDMVTVEEPKVYQAKQLVAMNVGSGECFTNQVMSGITDCYWSLVI